MNSTDVPEVQVQNCIFEATTPHPIPLVVVEGSENALIESCIFRGDTGLKFEFWARGEVRNCLFEGPGLAVLDSDIILEGTVFEPSPVGNLEIANSTISGSNNVFSGGEQFTIFFRDKTTASLHGSHIFQSVGPAVLVSLYPSPDYSLDLTGNYWGVTSEAEITTMITDGLDPGREQQPIVQFVPFSATPVPSEVGSMGALKARYRSQN